MLHDTVLFTKDDGGKTPVQETSDVPVGAGAASSAFARHHHPGALVGGAVSAGLGALSAKLIDIGIPDATAKEIEEALTPNGAALALLVGHVKEDPLAVELKRFYGATLTRGTLRGETVERLRNAPTRCRRLRGGRGPCEGGRAGGGSCPALSGGDSSSNGDGK